MDHLLEDLGRLSERGQRADPADVVARALTPAVPDERRRRWLVGVAASATVLVAVGALIGVSALRTPGPVVAPATLPVPVTIPTEWEEGPTSTFLVQPTRCPVVAFEFTDLPDGFDWIATKGLHSNTNNFYTPIEQLSFGRGNELREETIQGLVSRTPVAIGEYDTEVFGGLSDGIGPGVQFVFPADADPNDRCNVWLLMGQGNVLSAEQLVELSQGLRMEVIEDGASSDVLLGGVPRVSVTVTQESPVVRSNGEWTELDAGANANISVGMPVVSSAGLVGRVTSVSDETSQVLLVSDAQYVVEATTVEALEVRQLIGTGEWTAMLGGNSFSTHNLEVGDPVFTAGSRSTPVGIPIGSVSALGSIPIVELFADSPVAGDQLTVLLFEASEN
jgi:hypothetical protein